MATSENSIVRSNKPAPIKAQVLVMHTQGVPIAKIAKELKIAKDTVKVILEEGQVRESAQNSVERAMQKAGLTQEVIAEKLRRLMDATDVKRASFEGKFTDERVDPDNTVQFRAAEASAKIAGMFPKEDVSQVAQLFVRLPDVELRSGHGKTCTCKECCDAWETITVQETKP